MIPHPSLKTISRYLDNQLTTAGESHIKNHLEKCDTCRNKVHLLQLSGSFLKTPETMENISAYTVLDKFPLEIPETRREVIGEIKSILGMVLIKSGNQDEELEAFPGCALCKGDSLRTIGDSKALIEWNDGSQLYINKDTELGFHTSPHPLTLRLGEIFSMMNPQRVPFEIQTPSAVLSVIGTDFDTEVNKDNRTCLRVLKGKVAFKNKTGKVIVKKDKQVHAAEYTKPQITTIQQKQNIGKWIEPIKPLANKQGVIMKKLLIGIIVIGIIGVAGYFGYQYLTESPPVTAPQVQVPELPETVETVSTEPLNFKPKWVVGQRRINRIEVIQETDTKSSNNKTPPMKLKSHATEDISLTTVSTRPGGGYVIDFQVDRMRLTSDINTVSMVFDSDSIPTSQYDKQMGSMFRPLIGKKITMLLAEDGNVDSVSGIPEMMRERRKNTNTPAGTFGNMYNEKYFKSMMEGFSTVCTIAQRPLQIGESWPVNKEIDVPTLGKMKFDLNYTFTSWKVYEGATCALLNYTGTMKSTPNATATHPGMKLSITDAKFAGYSFVDPQKGELIESSANQNLVIDMTMQVPTPKGPQSQNIIMTIKQQVTSKIIKEEQVGAFTPSQFLLDTTSPVSSETTSNL